MLILKVYPHVHERNGKKKVGSDFVARYQEAEILRDNHRPRVINISVPGQGRYEEGLYTLSAETFRPGSYERLEMGFVELIPLDDAAKMLDKELKTWRSRKLA